MNRFLGIVSMVGVIDDGLVRQDLGMSMGNRLLDVLHLVVMRRSCGDGMGILEGGCWSGLMLILGSGLGISDS